MYSLSQQQNGVEVQSFPVFSNQVIVTLEGVTPETGCSVQVIPLDTKKHCETIGHKEIKFSGSNFLPSFRDIMGPEVGQV